MALLVPRRDMETRNKVSDPKTLSLVHVENALESAMDMKGKETLIHGSILAMFPISSDDAYGSGTPGLMSLPMIHTGESNIFTLAF